MEIIIKVENEEERKRAEKFASLIKPTSLSDRERRLKRHAFIEWTEKYAVETSKIDILNRDERNGR